jgi:hypothetical protein
MIVAVCILVAVMELFLLRCVLTEPPPLLLPDQSKQGPAQEVNPSDLAVPRQGQPAPAGSPSAPEQPDLAPPVRQEAPHRSEPGPPAAPVPEQAPPRIYVAERNPVQPDAETDEHSGAPVPHPRETEELPAPYPGG